MRRARALLLKAEARRGEKPDPLEPARKAARAYDHTKVVALLGGLNASALKPGQAEEAADLAWQSSYGGDEADALAGPLVARLAASADGKVPPNRVAEALFDSALALGRLGRSEDAITVYDEVVARFGQAPEPVLRELVAKALYNKAWTLGQLGRSEDAITVCGEVVARFGEATELGLRESVARALVNKGATLGELGRTEEAITVFDQVVERFGEATELGLREYVATALVNKGYRLGQLGRSEDAITVSDDVVARFGQAPEPALRETVAAALENRAQLHLGLDRPEAASRDYLRVRDLPVVGSNAIARSRARSLLAVALIPDLSGFASSQAGQPRDSATALRAAFRLTWLASHQDAVAAYGALIADLDGDTPGSPWLAKALACKGYTLSQTGDFPGELAAYRQILARFGDTADPEIRALVDAARQAVAEIEAIPPP